MNVAKILADTDANADPWWKDSAVRALAWWAETGQPFTVDDLRDLGVPEADHPNRWGALVGAALKRGLIEHVGYARSRKSTRHGGVLRVWRGSGSEAA